LTGSPRQHGEHGSKIHSTFWRHAGERGWWYFTLGRICDHAQDGEWQPVLRGEPRHYVTLHIGRDGATLSVKHSLFRGIAQGSIDAGHCDEMSAVDCRL
jgi:hypothetical protein